MTEPTASASPIGPADGRRGEWPKGWLVRSLDLTGSTMDDAKALARDAPRGCVTARSQSAGRGRLPGRAWVADAGHSLLATYWFPRDEFGGAPLPLLAGIATARSLGAWSAGSGAAFRNPLALKWPNDLVCGGRKLAGILCEGSADTVYAGIGVNCSQVEFRGEFRTPPSSALIEAGAAPDPLLLAALIALAFEGLSGGRNWKGVYEGLMDGIGSPSRFSPGIGSTGVDGVIRGVGEDGAILLETAGGVEAYHSGELSPRRTH